MNKDNIYKRRLLKLADFLHNLPRKRFDYNHWVGEDWEGRQNLSCGTTACAFGWAITIPSFRRLGLRMAPAGQFPYIKEGEVYLSIHQSALKLFGLDNKEFGFVFIPGTSHRFGNCSEVKFAPEATATPKQVAKHIRNFVKFKYGE